MKTVLAWVLMVLAIIGVIGIGASVLLSSVTGPYIWFCYSPWSENGITIDCSTWWGVLILLSIDLCVFAWGWGIRHDIKKKNTNTILHDSTESGASASSHAP